MPTANAPVLPDAELLQLCGEIAGCRRIMEAGWALYPARWDGEAEAKAYDTAQARVAEASRTRERLIPRVLELAAMTPAGTLAKARVVLALFGTSRGRRSHAVASLVAALDVVLKPNGTR